MPLRFILGRAGSGRTDFCVNEILKNKGEALLIVPEQHSFQAERHLLSKTGITGLGGAQVISFRRLAHKVLGETGRAGAKILDKAGKCIAVFSVMQKLEKRLLTFSLAGGGAIAAEISDMISEFKRYNLSPAGLKAAMEKTKGEALARKLHDLQLIYENYEEFIAGRFIDTDDDLSALARAIVEHGPFLQTEIYIDQFSSFTPQEYLCIGTFLQGAKRVSITLCMDAGGGEEFAPTRATKRRLEALCARLNKVLEPDVNLGENKRLKNELLHIEQSFFDYPRKKYEGEGGALELFAGQNPFTEAQWVAQRIISLCRDEGFSFRDITVAARGAGGDFRLVSAVLGRYEIPVFTDEKSPVQTHPIILFILSALEILIKGYSYETVFRYAKTGLLDFAEDEIDRLENYVLATNIRGGIWTSDEKWDVRAEMWIEKESPGEDERGIIDSARRKLVEPLESLRKKLIEGAVVREKCAAVYDFLTDGDIPEKVSEISALLGAGGDMSGASEYSKVFNILIDALDALAAAAGDEKMGLGRFQRLLEAAFAQFEIGIIPSALEQVTLCDIGRVRGHRSRALFIIGANDGVFPAVPDGEGLLTDTDRAELESAGFELAPGALSRAMDEQHLVYTTLAMPGERLFISYPVADMEGRGMLPSEIITGLGELFPRLGISDDLEGAKPLDRITLPEPTFEALISALRDGDTAAEWQSVYEWFSQNPAWRGRLSLARAALDYQNKPGVLPVSKEPALFYTSVSRLEKYGECPFSYFMEHMLKAGERKLSHVRAPEAGVFLHAVIDDFSRRLSGNMRSWRDIDEEYIDSELTEIIDEIYGRINRYIIESSKRASFLFARLRRIAKRAIALIAEHIRRGEFEPLGYEISFKDGGDFKPLEAKLPGGAKIRLTGRIDRADILKTPGGDFVRIIDYKSGAQDFDLSDVYHGLSLQLAVYLAALCENAGEGMTPPVRPAGMLYFRLDDPYIGALPSLGKEKIEKEIRKMLKMRGLLLADNAIIEKMGAGAVGHSDILPVRVAAGGFGKDSSVATMEEFSLLSKHVQSTVRKISKDIAAGKIDISPYAKGNKKACDYCPYKAACAFEAGALGCDYRRIYAEGKEKVFEKMRKDCENE